MKTSLDVTSVSSNGDTLEITDSKGVEGVDDVWFRFSFSDSGASGAVDICGSVTTIWDEVNRKGKVKLLFISRTYVRQISHRIFSGKIYTLLSVLVNQILYFFIVRCQF